jgi:sec-independent protein translocase protein TatA
MGSFFDAPWHWALIVLAALLLFGSSRLPGAAKALGSSMNIFKKAMRAGDEDDQSGVPGTTQATVAAPPPQITSTPSASAQQAQIDDLQRQLQDLQGQRPQGDAAPATDSRPHG